MPPSASPPANCACVGPAISVESATPSRAIGLCMMPASANDHEFAAQLAFFAILHRVDHDVIHAASDVLPAPVHEGPGVAHRLVAFETGDRSRAGSAREYGS